ncbi:nucleotidyltransferase family protein [Caenispirillum bisanense]|uniref:nucleotidyltransferase family protein n=1 Tax=Caenispirillum bisanense TaxID=414052 RepID=UPI0031DC1B3F
MTAGPGSRPGSPVAAAMVLAAGLGTRMRPITDHTPKCLVRVAGRTLLDRALDRVAEAGVGHAVVNLHHHADQVRAHLAARTAPPPLRLSDESGLLLETGGGLKKALPLLGDGPFLACNSDVICLNGPDAPAFRRLADAWDDAAMDALLLLVPTPQAHGYDGPGDFALDPDGRLRRRGEAAAAPFVYSGAMVCHPRLFAGAPDGAFSMNLLFDRALAAGRLHGLVHDGAWYHVGTPASIAATERLMGADSPAPAR